jgi:Flp pilus assembly protein TadG
MRLRSRSRAVRQSRKGVAAVELAILLPFLSLLFVISIDFSRVFYFTVTLNNCARDGAIYGSMDPTHSTDTAGIQSAAQADGSNMTPLPSISSTTGTDAFSKSYVQVTASYTFNTLINYPGIANTYNLSRQVRMEIAPVLPNFPTGAGTGAGG